MRKAAHLGQRGLCRAYHSCPVARLTTETSVAPTGPRAGRDLIVAWCTRESRAQGLAELSRRSQNASSNGSPLLAVAFTTPFVMILSPQSTWTLRHPHRETGKTTTQEIKFQAGPRQLSSPLRRPPPPSQNLQHARVCVRRRPPAEHVAGDAAGAGPACHAVVGRSRARRSR